MSMTMDLNVDSAKLVVDPYGNVHFLNDTQKDVCFNYTNVISGKSVSLEAQSIEVETYRNITELDKHALMDIVRKLSRVCTENLQEKAFLKKQLSELTDK